MNYTVRLYVLASISVLAGCAGSTGVPQTARADLFSHGSLQETAKATVFVSDDTKNAILAFPAGVTNPKVRVAVTDGISDPQGIAVGGSGTLFVYNYGYPYGKINEYAPGQTKPNLTFTPNGPGGYIAAGKDDTLYLVNLDGNIDVYKARATQPWEQLPNPNFGNGPVGVSSITVDASNDVFVVTGGGACCGVGVVEYPNASPNYFSVSDTGNMGGGLTTNAAGDLFASPGSMSRKGFIRVIPPKGTPISFKSPRIYEMSFDQTDRYIYGGIKTISIIDYRSKRVLGTVSGISNAWGVAVRPAAF